MKIGRIILIINLIFVSFFPIPAKAIGLHFNDNVSSVAPGSLANHDFNWVISDSEGIKEGESFEIVFDSSFDTSDITASDVDVLKNNADLTVSYDCSAQVKFTNSGNDHLTFQICPLGGGVFASGDNIRIKIGLNAGGGSHQIKNPNVATSYYILMNGLGDYADSDVLQVAIMSLITTSLQVGPQSGSLRFIGYASPGSLVFFLESGSVIGSQEANYASVFDKTFSSMAEGIHLISIYATDTGQRNTLTITFSINVIANATTIASGIVLPATITLTDSKVKRPAELQAAGKAKNNATVMVFIQGSGDSRTTEVATNASGDWSTNVNPKLHLGNKSTYSMVLDGYGGQSELSHTRLYEVLLSADLNVDNLVNITDFSILMYSYAKTVIPNVISDINDNNVVDLVDFSVMMSRWTGG